MRRDEFDPNKIGVDVDKVGKRIWRHIAIAVAVFAIFVGVAFWLSSDNKVIDYSEVATTETQNQVDKAKAQAQAENAPAKKDEPQKTASKKTDGEKAKTALSPEDDLHDDFTSETPIVSPYQIAIDAGNALMKNKDYDGALKKYNEAQAIQKTDEVAGLIIATENKRKIFAQKATVLQTAGDLLTAQKFDDAETEIMQALQIPDFTDDEELNALLIETRLQRVQTSLELGDQHLADKKWEEAELAFAWALSVEGFADNERALLGRKTAQEEMEKEALAQAQREREEKERAEQERLRQVEEQARLEQERLAKEAADKKLAEEKRVQQERDAVTYNNLMQRGQALLNAECWGDAQNVFTQALALPDYTTDNVALTGQTAAARGQENYRQNFAPYFNNLSEILRATRARDYQTAQTKLTAMSETANSEDREIISGLQNYISEQQRAVEQQQSYRTNWAMAEENVNNQNYRVAAEKYDAVAKNSAQPATVFLKAGLMYATVGEITPAEKSFLSARQSDAKLHAALLAETLLNIEQKNYERALTLATQYQENADNDLEKSWSATTLGWLYHDGGANIAQKRRAVNVDNEKSAQYFTTGARLGDMAATNNLGVCYLTARGVKRNFDEGKKYLESAGDFAPALFNLGLMYFRATGVTRSYEKAAEYFLRAADLGFARAAARLSEMYQRGRGVEKNADTADKYAKIANGLTDKDDDFALALPTFQTIFSAARSIPQPPPLNLADHNSSKEKLQPAYQKLLTRAQEAANNGKFSSSAANYGLLLQLPNYENDVAANRDLQTVNGKLQTLLTPSSTPQLATATSPNNNNNELVLPPSLNDAIKLPDEDIDELDDDDDALVLKTTTKTVPTTPAPNANNLDELDAIERALSDLTKIDDSAKTATPTPAKTAEKPLDLPAPKSDTADDLLDKLTEKTDNSLRLPTTKERTHFYQQAIAEAQKMLTALNWGYAEQAFRLALILPSVTDDGTAAEGLNKALEEKRNARAKFTDFEAILSNATAQMRDKQWLAAKHLYQYALTLDGHDKEPLALLGIKIADYEQAQALAANNESDKTLGNARDMASYNLAMAQAKNFLSEQKYEASIQLLKNILQWDDFKDDDAAKTLLETAELAQSENDNSPESLARQREKNKDLYEKLMFSGKVYLQNKNWVDAEKNFALVLKLKGYDQDIAANNGVNAAKNHEAEIREAIDPKIRAEFLALLNEARNALSNGNFVKAEDLSRNALNLRGFTNDEDGIAMAQAACKAQGKTYHHTPPQSLDEKLKESGFVTNEQDLERAAILAQYQAFLREGRQALETQQYDIAEAIFQEILRLPNFANDPMTTQLLQQAQNLKPKIDDVKAPEIPVAVSVQDSNAQQSELLQTDGHRLRNAGKLAEAIQSYSSAIDLQPERALLYANRADVRLVLGQLELALADYHKALNFKTLNKTEIGNAHNNIANIYYHGTNKDYVQAFNHYKLAAENGNAAAMNSFGVAYFMGRGIDADRKLALDWYRQSAENGYGNAMLNLGLSYDNGWGAEVNYEKAREWYEKATAQKNPRAFARLARFYREGLGVAIDTTKADNYAAQAKEHGYTADK